MTVITRIDHYSDFNELYPAAGRDDPFRKAKPYCEHCLGGDHRITYLVADDAGGVTQIADACLGIWLESDELADRARAEYLPKPLHPPVQTLLTPEQYSWVHDTDSPAVTPDHRTALAVGHCPPRLVESFKALGNAYARWLEAEKAKGPPSEYVGEEGERVDLELVCEKAFGPYETQYGQCCRYAFRAGPDGRDRLSWFTSADLRAWWEPGKTVKVRATIKEHKLYLGLRRTDLARVKLAKEEPS